MIYCETLDALCNLPNEDIGQIIKHIKNWNDGQEVILENPYHKMVWGIILPELERNKETYLTTLEKRQTAGRENGKLGGRPKKDKETQEKVMGFYENPKNPNYSFNYNNNISEDILLVNTEDGKQETSEEVSVSKGLESLENSFPERKRDIGIDEINLWNSLSQIQKSNLIKKGILYVRGEMKNNEGKYIKKLSKWLKEETDKGVDDELYKKKSSTKSTFKYTDGNIYSTLQDKLKSSTQTDKVYHFLNNYGLSPDEFRELVRTEDKETLLDLLKK